VETRGQVDHDPEDNFLVDFAPGEAGFDTLIFTGETVKQLEDAIAVVERACREARKQIDGVQVA
jgi:hypothetical protein